MYLDRSPAAISSVLLTSAATLLLADEQLFFGDTDTVTGEAFFSATRHFGPRPPQESAILTKIRKISQKLTACISSYSTTEIHEDSTSQEANIVLISFNALLWKRPLTIPVHSECLCDVVARVNVSRLVFHFSSYSSKEGLQMPCERFGSRIKHFSI